ncbi:hypothetical protein ACFQ9X_39675 [Catenulispora yoronensis]
MRTYRLLLPHVLALGFSAFEDRAATADDPGWRSLLLDVMHYLVVHADAGTARDLAQAAQEQWALGPDAVAAAERLAQARYRLGDLRQAAALTPVARPLVRASVTSATSAASATSASSAALAAGSLEGTMRRQTRILEPGARGLTSARTFAEELGPGHPDALRDALATAFDLRALGRHGEALALEEETHGRLLRTLGPEHPDTVRAALLLGRSCFEAGDAAGLSLQEDAARRLAAIGARARVLARTTNLRYSY